MRLVLYGALLQCLLSALAYGLELVEPSALQQVAQGVFWSVLIVFSAALQRAETDSEAKRDA